MASSHSSPRIHPLLACSPDGLHRQDGDLSQDPHGPDHHHQGRPFGYHLRCQGEDLGAAAPRVWRGGAGGRAYSGSLRGPREIRPPPRPAPGRGGRPRRRPELWLRRGETGRRSHPGGLWSQESGHHSPPATTLPRLRP